MSAPASSLAPATYALHEKGEALRQSFLALQQRLAAADPASTADLRRPEEPASPFEWRIRAEWMDVRVRLLHESLAPGQAPLMAVWVRQFTDRYTALLKGRKDYGDAEDEWGSEANRNLPRTDERRAAHRELLVSLEPAYKKWEASHEQIRRHIVDPIYHEWDVYDSWVNLLGGEKYREELPYEDKNRAVAFTNQLFGEGGVALELPLGLVLFEGRSGVAGGGNGEFKVNEIGVGSVVERKRNTSTSTSIRATFPFMGHFNPAVGSDNFGRYREPRMGTTDAISLIAANYKRDQPLLLAHTIASPHVTAIDIRQRQEVSKAHGLKNDSTNVEDEEEVMIRPFTVFHVVRDYVVLLGLPQTVIRVLETHLLPQGETCSLCHPPPSQVAADEETAMASTNKRKQPEPAEVEQEQEGAAAKKARMQARMKLHRLLQQQHIKA